MIKDEDFDTSLPSVDPVSKIIPKWWSEAQTLLQCRQRIASLGSLN